MSNESRSFHLSPFCFLAAVALGVAALAWSQQQPGIRLEAFAYGVLAGAGIVLVSYVIGVLMARSRRDKPPRPPGRSLTTPETIAAVIVPLLLIVTVQVIVTIWGSEARVLAPIVLVGFCLGVFISMGNVLVRIIHFIATTPPTPLSRAPKAPLAPLADDHVRKLTPDDVDADRGAAPPA